MKPETIQTCIRSLEDERFRWIDTIATLHTEEAKEAITHRVDIIDAALDDLAQPPPQVGDEQLREALAEYAHEAWSGWMRYMFGKGSFTTTWDFEERRKVQTFHLTYQFVERWQRQMNTPYADLPESEKASDRDEADKMLALIQTAPPQEGRS